MNIISDKYIKNYEDSGYDLYQRFLFGKILLNQRVVSSLRKYLSKSDCMAIGIW